MRKISCLLVTLSMLLSFFSSNVYAVTNSESLYNILQEKAILDNQSSEYVIGQNGIDLTKPSSETNGKGLYTIASTKDNNYPIHYYRGDIDDNNVVFAGACWKIVRTSETGGIKLIYNREASYDGENYYCGLPPARSINNYNDDLYHEGSLFGYMEGDIDLYDVNEILDIDYEYISFDISSLLINSRKNNIQPFFYPHNTHHYYSDTVRYDNGTYTLVNPKQRDSNSIDDLVHKYTCLNEETMCDDVAYITDWGQGGLYYVLVSNGDSYEEAKAEFEEQLKSIKFYMAKDIEWDKNNNSFKLIEPQEENFYNLVLGLNEGKNFGVNYHYLASKTNGNYSQNDPASFIYYVSDIDRNNFGHFLSEEYKDYLKFNVLEVPFGITMDSLRQELFETNKNESQVKKDIDLWYEQNIKDYAKYLEDTVWYNDRANNRYLVTNSLSTNSLYRNYIIDNNYYNFEVDRRILGNKIPSLKYPVLADKFTVSDKIGNGKLKYPIGLITADEVMYAAGIKTTCEGDYGYDGNYSYLARNTYNYTFHAYYDGMLTMSPDFIFQEDGFLHEYKNCEVVTSIDNEVNNYEIKPILRVARYEVLPMISLKNTVLLESGTGVENDPYVIAESYDVKYEYTGDVPENVPNMKTEDHKAKDEVTLPSAPEIKGYRFVGWETEDVTIKDNQFVMPEKDVTIKMRYVKLNSGLVPETLDSTYTYMITFVIGIIGLAIALIINKRRQINLN